MLRVATTASPISGSEVRDRIVELGRHEMESWASRYIQRCVRWRSSFRRQVASSASHYLLTQSGGGVLQSAEAMETAELVAALPDHYLVSTTADEREVSQTSHTPLSFAFHSHLTPSLTLVSLTLL